MIPVAEPLRIALDAAAKVKQSPLIMLNSEGHPWGAKGHGFRSSWRKASIKAGVQGVVQFTDLRGTAVTRLAIASCTIPEIASITGHTHAEVSRILEAHYLHQDPAIALAAINKLETAFVRVAAA